MKRTILLFVFLTAVQFTSYGGTKSFTVSEGKSVPYKGDYVNFSMTASVRSQPGGRAAILFNPAGDRLGYEVLVNGSREIDGSIKTGSLAGVRNLYKTTAKDGEWVPVEITMVGRNITIEVNGVQVVNYTQPDAPYRIRSTDARHIVFQGHEGTVEFRDVTVTKLPADATNPDALDPIDEQNDPIIRLQQQDFPVIDYHVHLKGWGKEAAHLKSMNYGINYSIAPNCGIGFTITNDAQVIEFCDSTQHMPFMFGMQGEGREWPRTFSADSRGRFDYVFTDALTFTDHKGRRTLLWIDDQVFVDIPHEEYMDLIVDKIVEVIETEPIDVYVNPCFLPTVMEKDYDKLWTQPRIDRVVAALKKTGIALEINAYYGIPNFATIRAAKEAGVKFAFGTNNVSSDIGKLEYCLEAMEACGITADDMWFPSMKANR